MPQRQISVRSVRIAKKDAIYSVFVFLTILRIALCVNNKRNGFFMNFRKILECRFYADGKKSFIWKKRFCFLLNESKINFLICIFMFGKCMCYNPLHE